MLIQPDRPPVLEPISWDNNGPSFLNDLIKECFENEHCAVVPLSTGHCSCLNYLSYNAEVIFSYRTFTSHDRTDKETFVAFRPLLISP